MIDAFYNGDYDLIAIDRTWDSTARVRFVPFAWPIGGTGCMKALMKTLEGQITAESLT